MRNIINISLPEALSKDVSRAVKNGKYASKSEFFRELFRKWQEDKLLKELEESRSEFRAGKFKTLRFLKDLR